jgi:alpha-1,2-mannosyltransferase
MLLREETERMMRTQAATSAETGGRANGGGRWWLAAGGALFALAIAAYLIAIALHPGMTAMLKGFDLRVYLGGGLLARHAPAELYSTHFFGMKGIAFTYPPFAALIFAVLSYLPWRAVEVIAVIVSTGALLTTVWIAFRSLGISDRTRRFGLTLLVAGLVFWVEPVQRALFLGQVELALMCLVTWDMCQSDRRWFKGIGVGIAAGIKLVPVVFIAYLLITRRIRAAVVATVTFAVTVVLPWPFLPGVSDKWWLHGYFWQANKTGFVAYAANQSLRGLVDRFVGSDAHGQPVWYVAAVITGLLGLWAAYLLHRSGRDFEGVMTVALVGLLDSPISWDHHWVWIAPFLAIPVAYAFRGYRAAWIAVTGLLVLAFLGWPKLWNAGQGKSLIWLPPSSGDTYGDNPARPEYHWHGIQLLEGNLYVLIGCFLFLVALAFAWRIRTAAPVTSAAGHE